jgi:hypothetical protein
MIYLVTTRQENICGIIFSKEHIRHMLHMLQYPTLNQSLSTAVESMGYMCCI